MNEKEFTNLTTKLLKELVYEKEHSNLRKFTTKYNLHHLQCKKMKRKFIKWTIHEVMILLEILGVSLYDFAVMLEENIEKENLKNER